MSMAEVAADALHRMGGGLGQPGPDMDLGSCLWDRIPALDPGPWTLDPDALPPGSPSGSALACIRPRPHQEMRVSTS